MTTMCVPTELDFGRIKVCGRKEELKQLGQALARVASGEDDDSSSCEAIVIEAESGKGKSFLLHAFHESICHRRDLFFCQGKYDDQSGGDFSAIKECIDMLVCQMVKDSIEWKTLMDQALTPPELKLLSNLAPNIHEVLGTCEENEELQESATRHLVRKVDARSTWGLDRLRLAIRSLFRMICQHRSVVFVQDDMQWMDEASMNIIKTIVFDNQAKRLLFLGTHRQLDTTKSISDLFSKATNDRVTVLKLENLSLQAVTEVISSLT